METAIVRKSGVVCVALALLGACAAPTQHARGPEAGVTASADAGAVPPATAQTVAWLDRLTWGANDDALRALGASQTSYLERQLKPNPDATLPAAAASQISAMTITRVPLPKLVADLEAQRRSFADAGDGEQKQAARKAYQQELNRLEREAASRFLLRALYSPAQLQEQLTWFWTNHFNVHARKGDLRAMVGDYEERAIRAHALGRFRDLLGATAHHPAMLRYLDNERNADGHINENYARELMELHTLGVEGGYTQRDVQELARILTGVGVNVDRPAPRLKPALAGQYVRDGLFEFNPRRHDYGDKQFLGHTIRGRGLAELDEALDILARHPATARHVSRELASCFVADEPPADLVEHMARRFTQTDGDIPAVLRVMFASDAFQQSLGHKFRDSLQYVVASVRLSQQGRVVLDTAPMLAWADRLGEPLYGRQTPDGYPMRASAWNGSGQMTTRFEIARAVGAGAPALFRGEEEAETMKGEAMKSEAMKPRAAPPALERMAVVAARQAQFGPNTRQALKEAKSPAEWNAFLLASPEMMYR